MKFQITLRPSVVSLRRPFFQSLISLLRLSHLDGDFSMLGMCPRQIYKLSKCQSQQWSHCSVREQQQEESCVSHVKICGCCEEKLQSCCALGWGQTVLRAAGAGGAFCWILLFQQGKIYLNSSNIGVSGTTLICACSGEWWVSLMNTSPPSVLLSFHLELGLPPLGFWAWSKTRSAEAEEDFACLDYGGITYERRSSFRPVPLKTHFDAPGRSVYLRHFSWNLR